MKITTTAIAAALLASTSITAMAAPADDAGRLLGDYFISLAVETVAVAEQRCGAVAPGDVDIDTLVGLAGRSVWGDGAPAKIDAISNNAVATCDGSTDAQKEKLCGQANIRFEKIINSGRRDGW